MNEGHAPLKIGIFAKRNGTTIDAIRHYMDLGLLLPEKQGSHYVFDEICQREYEMVVEYKSMGFSLAEILNLFHFMRLGALTSYEKAAIYQSFFSNRARQLQDQIDVLQRMKMQVERQIEAFEGQGDSAMSGSQTILQCGIPLKHLSLLACPACGNPLELTEGRVAHNTVHEGMLSCLCGKCLHIENGILMAIHKSADSSVEEPGITCVTNESYLTDYICETAPEYLAKLNESLSWIRRRFASMDLNGKVVIELGTGAGFFLRNVVGDLGDAIYLAVDRDHRRLCFVKEMIEKAGSGENVLFICADFRMMPLKKGIVDVVADISGTSNFAFEDDRFLPMVVDEYLKRKSDLLGAYIIFDGFAKNSSVPLQSRDHYRVVGITDSLEKQGFRIMEDALSETVGRGGPYEDYFKDGEKVRTFVCHAHRE